MSPATSPATLIVSLPSPPMTRWRRRARSTGRRTCRRPRARRPRGPRRSRSVTDEAGAEDRLRGDDDVVGELGAEDDDLVEAVAAVDRDRRVDVVLDLVLAAAGADVGLGARSRSRSSVAACAIWFAASRQTIWQVGSFTPSGAGAVAGRLGEREGADDEEVVVVVALEPQRRLVRVDGELSSPVPPCDEQRLAVPGLSQPRVVATVANGS